jgi:hypothetical protein
MSHILTFIVVFHPNILPIDLIALVYNGICASR